MAKLFFKQPPTFKWRHWLEHCLSDWHAKVWVQVFMQAVFFFQFSKQFTSLRSQYINLLIPLVCYFAVSYLSAGFGPYLANREERRTRKVAINQRLGSFKEKFCDKVSYTPQQYTCMCSGFQTNVMILQQDYDQKAEFMMASPVVGTVKQNFTKMMMSINCESEHY